MSLDSPGGKQPSPVAKERCVRSIRISRTNIDPVSSKLRSPNEAKHDVLDQEALTDFTHPALRTTFMTCKESQRQTTSESQRQEAMSPNSFLLRRKVGLTKYESKPKFPPGNKDVSEILKPKSNKEQQHEFLQHGASGTQTSLSESEGIAFTNVVQRASRLAFDGLPIESRLKLHRKCVDYPQIRTAGFGSYNQLYEQTYAEKSAALSATPPVLLSTQSFLNQSTVLSRTEKRTTQLGFNAETEVDITFLSDCNLERPLEENHAQRFTGTSSRLLQQTGESQSIKSPQKHRFRPRAQSQNAQMDVERGGSRFHCVSKDYSCQSKDIDQKMEFPQSVHRLDQFHTEQAIRPASVEHTTSKATFSKSDVITRKHQLACKQHPGQNKGHNEGPFGDTGLNQTAEVPRELPECPSEKCVVNWSPSVAQRPFNTSGFGISSKGVFDLLSQPQPRVYQRPDETTMTALPPRGQSNDSPADRAFIMEEPEDPYYVTMYHPGSVYVGEYRDGQTA